MKTELIKQLEQTILKMEIEISKKKIELNDLLIEKKREEIRTNKVKIING